ncbi:TonB-dependent receptor domain-containing protein [Pseudoduganella umbonata]|uniref:Iron complex outermembrane receptor protein n=1 Tax=Pseudoduganella umbonata TaxID=864828 RepID=A0A4P8HPJ8_9BURK|nr:TonB-dependent receptor [Pseudoduganella umbonata]MBB3221031.1 iron complex outermembrane receptor protein [Pseudoduganella umbonata]QCP10235.1 TonB-dependent receptor [Pseudoduganella umbonata]
MYDKRTPLALAIALAFGSTFCAASGAYAQASQGAGERHGGDPDSIPTVLVSASALGVLSDDMITPATTLSGDELVRVRESTLGETLGRLPGITSSHFGAGASRPVIRGMDGPRVKILADGAEVQDASTISPDHAVAFEPLLAERIEVLRGPSALAYGGGAVGGVVNIIDRKIPTALPSKAVEGSAELRASSAAREKAGAFEMTAAAGSVAFHAEGAKRDAGDYRVGKDWAESRRVNGSFKESETGTVGVSWIGERGYLGAAYTKERTEYGIPGHAHEFEGCHPHGDHLHCGEHEEEEEGGHDHGHEEEGAVPYVKLDSDRWDVRGEYRDPLAGFSKVRVRASYTDYRHAEIEGTEVATTFTSKAHDARLELEHKPVAGWRGVVGLQTTRRDFAALGEEAYVPATLTKKHAAFVTEEYRLDAWRFEAALRHEWQDIEVEGTRERDRDARGTSLALGAVWKFAPQYSLRAAISRSHRLPGAEELYADGIHLATSTWEIGNENLTKETSNNVDITLRKFAGPTTFSLSAFHNRIDNYIYARTLDNHEGFQLVEYAQQDATFTGIEGELRQELSASLQATLFGDYVRARLRDGGGNIPRIPAGRLGARLDGEWQGWHGMVEAYRVATQDDTATYEGRTSGYNMLNLGTHYNVRIAGLPAQLYARLNNVTDELAYSHTSFIKAAAPLPGRNLTAGLRVSF